MAPPRLGTFEELVADVDAQAAAIADRLRSLILEVHPDAVEVVRLGDGAATFGVGPRKMKDGYCYIMPQRGYANLGFYQGAILGDPDALLEGSGKSLRHVKVRSITAADDPALRHLVRTALAERRRAHTLG